MGKSRHTRLAHLQVTVMSHNLYTANLRGRGAFRSFGFEARHQLISFFCRGFFAFLNRLLKARALLFENEPTPLLRFFCTLTCFIRTLTRFFRQLFCALSRRASQLCRLSLQFESALADLLAGFFTGLRR